MAYKTPDTIWEAAQKLSFNEPLDPDDPRFVSTEKARGDFSISRQLKAFGVDPETNTLRFEPERVYSIFCGHRGCGKSTELRRLHRRLNQPSLFFVVFLDVLVDLDPNNLQYSDALMAMAKRLFARLIEEQIPIKQVFLVNLQTWFGERIEQHDDVRDFAIELKAGFQVETGLPWLAKLFAGITNALKTNSTHKETLRRIVKNSFTEFSSAFNMLIRAAEAAVQDADQGRKILFIVDGSDRLSSEDARRFFVDDVYQLQHIESNFIYCAPISLIYEGIQVQNAFNDKIVLPMIKLHDQDGGVKIPAGYDALRKLIFRRADKTLFDSRRTVDYLIEYSGGSPRELLRLLHYTYQNADNDKFDRPAAEKAVRQLAVDYRRILDHDDYPLLCRIDRAGEEANSDQARRLLFNLALLEYNSFWWKSHPVIRTLPAYQHCLEGLDGKDSTSTFDQKE
ncbi:MAG: ATP-binding protein [Pseudomonadota bacterium]